MVFSDLFFLFVFLPAFLLCYLLATWVDRQWLSSEGMRSNKAKNLILTCFMGRKMPWIINSCVYVYSNSCQLAGLSSGGSAGQALQEQCFH